MPLFKKILLPLLASTSIKIPWFDNPPVCSLPGNQRGVHVTRFFFFKKILNRKKAYVMHTHQYYYYRFLTNAECFDAGQNLLYRNSLALSFMFLEKLHQCLKLVERKKLFFWEFSFFQFLWLCQSEALTPAVLWMPRCVGHSMGSAWINWRADLVEINDQQDTMCDFVSSLALLIGAARTWDFSFSLTWAIMRTYSKEAFSNMWRVQEYSALKFSNKHFS